MTISGVMIQNGRLAIVQIPFIKFEFERAAR